ncbi:potassium channel family protein [Loktanella sp. R86503]|uniref:potassium channel family protein n=1 Tax=Loktanella sp. R86503 TaxID=3093847 RepID=UPI0036D75E9E
MKSLLAELYSGHSDRAVTFRYALVAFDLLTVIFVIVTSFFEPNRLVLVLDLTFGAIILVDFLARGWIENQRLRAMLRLTTWADLAAIISFLAPVVTGQALAFLRVLRTLRLLRSYELLSRLRRDSKWFREREDIILAVTNLIVFLFIMTGLIYASQVNINDQINNYADAFYFTVTTLTTTGFGDITLDTTWGRMLAVAVMIIGVSLFLQMLQVLFRPPKVRQECPTCGLILHDADAVHCKHCGETIHIQTEGAI